MAPLRTGALAALLFLLAPAVSATAADSAVTIAWTPLPATRGTFHITVVVDTAADWRLVTTIGTLPAHAHLFSTSGPDTFSDIHVGHPCPLGAWVTADLYRWSFGAWQPSASASLPCPGT